MTRSSQRWKDAGLALLAAVALWMLVELKDTRSERDMAAAQKVEVDRELTAVRRELAGLRADYEVIRDQLARAVSYIESQGGDPDVIVQGSSQGPQGPPGRDAPPTTQPPTTTTTTASQPHSPPSTQPPCTTLPVLGRCA